ncbi:MAG: S10 family peptidase [Terracidiphilus sp.]
MSIFRPFPSRLGVPALACALCCALSSFALAAACASAQSDRPSRRQAPEQPAAAAPASPSSQKPPAAEKSELPPLPPPAHVEQSIVLNGKTLHYTVTIGATDVRDDTGKVAGKVVTTAYTVDGANNVEDKDRPVTFAVNGGPGASSVYLNFGAIGPRHLNFGNAGESASEAPTLTDNPGTWLDFTDLVFIDPIGTGFSRSLVPDDQAKKLFYSTVPDIDYLSRVIYDWLVQNGRLDSRKYIVGESYGGFRVPRMTYYLQSQLGVGMSGEVLVSPYLNPTDESNGDLSPLPWMITLPSITAAHLEREHKLTPEAMQAVIGYTLGTYATTLIAGRSDPAATQAMIQKVTEMTGLDPTFVKQSGGRLETGAYLREVYREQGKLGSVYDSNVTSFDPFPYAPQQRANDPILAGIIAPVTTAMVNFITQTVGWKVDARYNALSYEVGGLWVGGDQERAGSAAQLREAVAADPDLRVLIAHGWNDLSCPFMGSLLTVDQMPVMGDPTRVAVHEYPGGHMFYTRLDSRLALRKDVMAMYSKH